jgi:hypothetical protein
MNRASLLAVLALACTGEDTDTDVPSVPDPDEDPIIFVGNPGSSLTVAPTGTTSQQARVRLDTLTLVDCADGLTAEVAVGLRELPDPTPFALPSVNACSLDLHLSELIEVSGSGSGPDGHLLDLQLRPFSVSLQLAAPWLLGPMPADSEGEVFNAYVIELGSPGWAELATTGLAAGDVTVGPADPLHGPLQHALRQGSGLYVDLNQDGELDEAERAAGPLATPAAADESGLFIALTEGAAATLGKPDGQTWLSDRPVPNELDGDLRLDDVAVGGGRYLAVGSDSDLGRVFASSEDGLNWSAWRADGAPTSDLAWGDGRFVAVGGNDTMALSDDGLNWTDVPAEDNTYWKDVAWGDGRFVAVGVGSVGVVTVSEDGGETWTEPVDVGVGTATEGVWLYGVAWGGGRFVAVGLQGRRMRSTDGLTWTDDALGDADFSHVTWDGNRFLAVGDGFVEVSTDGAAWTRLDAPGTGPIAAGPAGWLRVAGPGEIGATTDLTLGTAGWSPVLTGAVEPLTSVFFVRP